MMTTYAVDYGYCGPDGHLQDLDLRPMLDLVAARYAGCDSCATQQTSLVAAEPALVTHVVGVALCALTSINAQASATLVVQKLPGPGAAIALTMRAHGLRSAVDVAASMPLESRRSAVDGATGCMLPTGWYNQPLGTFYKRGRAAADDAAALADLRAWD